MCQSLPVAPSSVRYWQLLNAHQYGTELQLMLSGHFGGTRIYAKDFVYAFLSERCTITKSNRINFLQALSHQTPLDKFLKLKFPFSQSLR